MSKTDSTAMREPVHAGDVVSCCTQIERVGRTSIPVRIEAVVMRQDAGRLRLFLRGLKVRSEPWSDCLERLGLARPKGAVERVWRILVRGALDREWGERGTDQTSPRNVSMS